MGAGSWQEGFLELESTINGPWQHVIHFQFSLLLFFSIDSICSAFLSIIHLEINFECKILENQRTFFKDTAHLFHMFCWYLLHLLVSCQQPLCLLMPCQGFPHLLPHPKSRGHHLLSAPALPGAWSGLCVCTQCLGPVAFAQLISKSGRGWPTGRHTWRPGMGPPRHLSESISLTGRGPCLDRYGILHQPQFYQFWGM